MGLWHWFLRLTGLFGSWSVTPAGTRDEADGIRVRRDPEAQESALLQRVEVITEAQLAAARESPRYVRAIKLEQMLDEKVERLEAKLFYSKLAGVSHHNLRGPSRQKLILELAAGDQLWLDPEPENRHDVNAIRVLNGDGDQVGYLNERVAAEFVGSRKRGHEWECFVSEITGWDHKTHGVNVALLHWDPEHAARPEREFDHHIRAMAESFDGQWRYVRLVGLTKRNADGSRRAQLWGSITPRETLGLRPDSEDRNPATRVQLVNNAGQILGTLQKKDSEEVLDGAAAGVRWIAVYRGCDQEEGSGFRPYVALVRCGSVDGRSR